MARATDSPVATSTRRRLALVMAVYSSSRVSNGDSGGGSTTVTRENCEPWALCTVNASRGRSEATREQGSRRLVPPGPGSATIGTGCSATTTPQSPLLTSI